MTREEIIIDMMPFSKQLKEWCKIHPEFAEALKINYPTRFITLQAITISYSHLIPEDEVIGVYTYDYQSKPGKFKQDFIVNKSNQNKEFILFTRLPSRKYSKYVKDISEFFAIYSKGKYYIDSHHVIFKNLPNSIKPRAAQAIKLAESLRKTGLRKLTEKELAGFESKIKKLNTNNTLPPF